MTYLSKDDILKADDRPTKDIDVPEWGGVIRLKAMTGTARDELDASRIQQMPDGREIQLPIRRAKLVALSAVNPDTGDPLFNELEVGQLGQKSAAPLDRLAMAALELSGLTGSTTETELEGNSEAATNGGSGSDSPEN